MKRKIHYITIAIAITLSCMVISNRNLHNNRIDYARSNTIANNSTPTRSPNNDSDKTKLVKNSNKWLDVSDQYKKLDNETEVFASIDRIFSREITSEERSQDRDHKLANINRMGHPLLNSIEGRLSSTKRTDAQITENMYLVDYLSYRSRWDASTFELMLKIIASNIVDEAKDNRSKASIIADNFELVRSASLNDWEKTTEIVSKMKNDLLAGYARESLIESLLDSGLDYNAAIEKMKLFFPGYSRKEFAGQSMGSLSQKS